MFCLNCGKPVPQTLPECDGCGQSLRLPQYESRQNGLLYFLTRPLPFALLGLFLLGLVLFLFRLALTSLATPDPIKTVQSFMREIEQKNRQQAIEYLLPDQREQGLGFSIELAMQPDSVLEYEDLQYHLVAKDNEKAQVRLSGRAKLTLDGKARQIILNTELQLYWQDKTWYLDLGSIDRLFVM